MLKHRYLCTMNLEKDLQQSKPFKTEQQRAMVNLFFTSKFVETLLQKKYKQFGVTMKQYNILRILNGADKPLSTQVIRERMIDRMSDISRIVDRMIDKNLLSKCVNSSDKRLVDISISAKGKQKLEELGGLGGIDMDFLTILSEEEAKLLNKLLDKIRGYE